MANRHRIRIPQRKKGARKQLSEKQEEGKLKQEIRRIAEQDGKYANVETAFIRIGQVDSVLDEAKADLPFKIINKAIILKNGSAFKIQDPALPLTPQVIADFCQWLTKWLGSLDDSKISIFLSAAEPQQSQST